MTTNDISERLRLFRESLGKTQEEFAADLGISRSTVINYESGKRPVTMKLANRLREKYGINPSWLMKGVGKMECAAELSDEGFRIHQMLQKTAQVLESTGVYRTALASNINAFHQAIQTEAEIAELRKENRAIMQVMQEFQKQMAGMIEDMKLLKQENVELKKEYTSGNIGRDSLVEAEPSKSRAPRKSSEQ